jgi:hypothetical protein
MQDIEFPEDDEDYWEDDDNEEFWMENDVTYPRGTFVKVDSYPGVAFRVQALGMTSGEVARVVMVGDDRVHEVDIDEISLLPREDFCGECGQIGCAHDGLEREVTERDYNVCPANKDGKHDRVVANLDLEIADTHVSVACTACGTTTGYPISEFVDDLEWN